MKYKVITKRWRKETLHILDQINEILSSYDVAVSVRQIFYRLVAASVIKNTKQNYMKVSRIVTEGRYAGALDWDLIEDSTRGAYKTTSWPHVNNAVEHSLKSFRLDRWKNSPYYLEAWVEKRTMTGLFYQITNRWDIRLNVGGGFNSASAMWDAFKRFYSAKEEGKELILLYFGDYDPSGDFMSDDVKNRIEEILHESIHVERVLLNETHVQKHKLPKAFEVMSQKSSGETYDKLKADPRAKRFIDKHGQLFQVEVEALDPNALLGYVEKSILKYVDISDYEAVLKEEKVQVVKIERLLKK